MNRSVDNWIDSYLVYMERTESAKILHKWAAVSCVASALRKKVKLALGRISIFPNLYIVFVGKPGGPRKSQAITFATRFLNYVPEIIQSADAITPQALLQDLEECSKQETMPDGTIFTHSSISIISKEFESFLGQKAENTRMLIYLTDLFDAQEMPWKYRTKHSGSNVIPSVFLNLLAATTPESISSSLPSSAIGSGLTSRILFIWAEGKEKKVTAPMETEADKELRKKMQKDLYLISRIVGIYKFETECYKKWDAWYQSYDEHNLNRICPDPTFDGWYERKSLFILKISLICAAAESSEMLIHWRHIEKAMELLAEMEKPMSNVFKAVGRSTIAPDVQVALSVVKARGWVTEHDLLEMIWRDVDASKFDNVMNTLTKSGQVRRSYMGPKEETGSTWYKYLKG